MPTGLAVWSETAALNANVDSSVNWQEGQAPSSVNDSARAMMASAAKWRDDISGLIVSSGTSTAYSITSRQNFASLAAMDGLEFAFTPHTTCGDSPTLSIDGLSGQPIKGATGLSIPNGTLLAGTPYGLLYSNASNSFFLKGFFGNPYNVPIGAGLDFWGTVAPNSSFAFCTGSAISRTTYATLFSIIGTSYGAGDGSTTFNMPDKRGRVSAGSDPTGLRLSGASMNFLTNGGVGGAETHAIAQANLPNTNFNVSNGSLSVTSTVSDVVRSSTGPSSFTGTVGGVLGMFASASGNSTQAITSTGTVTGQTAASGGSGTALVTQPPTILCNYIMRII